MTPDAQIQTLTADIATLHAAVSNLEYRLNTHKHTAADMTTLISTGSSSSVTVPGSDTDIIFNASGAFSASDDFQFLSVSNTLSFTSGGKISSPNATGGTHEMDLFTGNSATSGTSGSLFIYTGTGYGSGRLSLSTGNASGGNNAGGNIDIESGFGAGTQRGGDINIISGNGGSGGNGGAIEINSGAAGGGEKFGGVIEIIAGDSSGSQLGAFVNIFAGTGGPTGSGGGIDIIAGNAGASATDKYGGSVEIVGGNGKGSGNGGDIEIQPGLKGSTGNAGRMVLENNATTAKSYRTVGRTTTTDNAYHSVADVVVTGNNSAGYIRARVVGHRTGGSGGTANDMFAAETVQGFKNNAGTVTLVGSLTFVFFYQDVANTDTKFVVNGTNIELQVRGDTNNNYTFNHEMWYMNV